MKSIVRFLLPVFGAILWLSSPVMKASSPNAHYWIDRDKLIEGTATLNGDILSLDIDVSKYPGAHTLHYRIQDQDGKWSAPICVPFISNPQTSGGNAKGFEFWIDKEYDRKQKKDVVNDIAFFDFDCEDLAPGAHAMYYRFEDEYGVFGSVKCHVFYKALNSSPRVIWYRYWWNDRYDLAIDVDVDSAESIFVLDTDVSIPDYAVDENNGSHKAYLNILFGDNGGEVSEILTAEVDYESYLMDVEALTLENSWKCHTNDGVLTVSGLVPDKGIIRVFALDGRLLHNSVPKHESLTLDISESAVIVCHNGVSRKVLLK